jgi:mono/diheme cytochrome c family protein
MAVIFTIIVISACHIPSPPPTPDDELIEKGRNIFFNETFKGNGRTCGTCHPRDNNFTIDPAFIATLPENDPLFVAEFIPELKKNFENPKLMREFGLILENLDGFEDLANKFTMRGVPHTLALRTSVDSGQGPRTGWSGDGAPGDGTLRSFATGAVIQHFTKTLNRVPGIDFRLPTQEELDALEAFQFSLGRQADLTLPLPLKGPVAKRGQGLFNSATEGKCSACHFNAGANGAANIFGPNAGNLNFNTGVEDLPDQPADLSGENIPEDDGFGIPGDGTFNTPPLVEAADSPPFFHNNSVATIEGSVAFYNGDTFNVFESSQCPGEYSAKH